MSETVGILLFVLILMARSSAQAQTCNWGNVVGLAGTFTEGWSVAFANQYNCETMYGTGGNELCADWTASQSAKGSLDLAFNIVPGYMCSPFSSRSLNGTQTNITGSTSWSNSAPCPQGGTYSESASNSFTNAMTSAPSLIFASDGTLEANAYAGGYGSEGVNECDGSSVVNNTFGLGIGNLSSYFIPIPSTPQTLSWSAPDGSWSLNLSPIIGALAPIDDGCKQPGGSSIGCQNQSLGEDIPIVGTGFFLHYEGTGSRAVFHETVLDTRTHK